MKKFKEILAETSRGGGGMNTVWTICCGIFSIVISKINSLLVDTVLKIWLTHILPSRIVVR